MPSEHNSGAAAAVEERPTDAPAAVRARAAPAGARGVVFLLGESSAEMYGQGRGVRILLRNLARSAPAAVVFRAPALAAALERDGVPVHIVPAENDLTGFRRRPLAQQLALVAEAARAAARLVPLLGRARPAAVYAGDAWTFWVALPAARLAGARIVLAVRDAVPPRAHWRWAARLADRVVVLSGEMREQVMRALGLARGAAAGRVRVIYNAVDFDAVEQARETISAEDARRELGLPPDAFLIGQVGALSPKKAQLAFIEGALPRIAAAAPRAFFCFVGGLRHPDDAAYEARCRKAVRGLGLESRVRFAGYQENIHVWYRALDLLVLPSRHEGLARAMIEALAFGVPVVSTAVLSAREILEANGCGIVVPPEEPARFAEAVLRLVEDAARRERLGRRAGAAARRLFDARAVAAAYESVFYD
jgi:glycosyltransferase involved in cell wall biosynthesis